MKGITFKKLCIYFPHFTHKDEVAVSVRTDVCCGMNTSGMIGLLSMLVLLSFAAPAVFNVPYK